MNPSRIITPPTDRELLRVASAALRASAEVHAAERTPFGPDLVALADHIDEHLRHDEAPQQAALSDPSATVTT